MHPSSLSYVERSLPPNFTDALFDLLKNYGSRPALIDPESKEQITFEGLEGLVQAVAIALLEKKHKKGQRIAIVSGNSLDFLVFILAALKIGLVLVPINPASKRGEIQKHVEETDSFRIFTEMDIRNLIVLSLKAKKEAPSFPKIEAEDLALVFFSSGTTGPPKAVAHNHRGLVFHLQQALIMKETTTFPRINADDMVHGVLPYFHFGGLMTVFLFLGSGASVLINKRWDENKFVQNLLDYQVTIINIVPPILSFLAFNRLIRSCILERLRRIYVGAAACDPKLMDLVKAHYNVEIVQLFGMTEAGLALIMSPNNFRRTDKIGIPLPGVVAKISAENELLVRAPTLMQGYLNSRVNHLDEEGFFNTGDLATVSPEGLFSIIGRVKDAFKVKGWQVNPWELEEAIKAFPGVVDCAVVGVPHSTDGYRPKAFVQGRVDPEEVLKLIKDQFISYKHLGEVQIVEDLPRNPSGKILKRELLYSK